jgi:ketosteroid isomerase-like protein
MRGSRWIGDSIGKVGAPQQARFHVVLLMLRALQACNDTCGHMDRGGAMSSVDLTVAALDWLEAYRAGDPFIVDCYSDDASLRCDCIGGNELRGTDAITAYWRQRLIEKPADELIDLQLDGSDIVLHYRVAGGVVQARLTFDADGSLRRSRCGPLKDINSDNA